MRKFHNISPLFLSACDACGEPLDNKAEMLCPECKAKRKQYPVEIWCKWCAKFLRLAGWTASLPDIISHGICDTCLEKEIEKLDEVKHD